MSLNIKEADKSGAKGGTNRIKRFYVTISKIGKGGKKGLIDSVQARPRGGKWKVRWDEELKPGKYVADAGTQSLEFEVPKEKKAK